MAVVCSKELWNGGSRREGGGGVWMWLDVMEAVTQGQCKYPSAAQGKLDLLQQLEIKDRQAPCVYYCNKDTLFRV